MKRIYWRPRRVSRVALALIACVSLVALAATEIFPVQRKLAHHETKIAAARLAREGMNAIKAEKKRLGITIDREVDPAESGMIGESITAVTSNTGYVSAKRTSTNPNFAAVIVEYLKTVDIERGAVVAVATSGSFPSLNLATYAALETLDVVPLIISSAASSEWGANHVNYGWLDMERTLFDAKLIGFRSIAASIGGIDDRGVGISKNGIRLIEAAIERNATPILRPESLSESVDERMRIYQEAAAGRPIRAYINVGGGSASVGTHIGKKRFKPGVNRSAPDGGLPDSVMLRFVNADVPVIHISRINLIAQRYGLPIEPTELPPIGQGAVYSTEAYNPWLAGGGIVVIFLALLGFIRLDFGVRILRSTRQTSGDASHQAEPMV